MLPAEIPRRLPAHTRTTAANPEAVGTGSGGDLADNVLASKVLLCTVGQREQKGAQNNFPFIIINIMANYDYTSIYPPPQKTTSRVVNRVSVSCSEDTEEEDAKEIRDLARCTQSSSSNRQRVQTPACPSQTTSMLRRKCNNSNNARRTASVAQNKKKNGNMAHRLIECLFCKCEDGNYARQLLFQFQQKTNEFFPDLEDETFYIYYKILINTMLFTGLFTVSLSLWHFWF